MCLMLVQIRLNFANNVQKVSIAPKVQSFLLNVRLVIIVCLGLQQQASYKLSVLMVIIAGRFL